MSSIRILSDRVANQIAAGEVIERPVAVVKELVENSIDAGATRINIEFRNGGKSYIRIEDNGTGMSANEAMLALERHATSKIREAVDLNEIQSFGFRGEALPSIASVSKFTLRTRNEDTQHGTEIQINSGKLIERKDCGMPVGTVIEVAHLFNSVPARRKFLKTDVTETAHITYHCRLFAVAHPSIAFRVLENGRTVFQSPTCNQLSDRIAEIWGRNLADDLMPVEANDAGTGLHLSGLIAKSGVGRSTRRELITLVNRRPVDSRTLSLAVVDAYHGRIQKGRFPPAFLFLSILPREVDVNVHPAKREVRFRNEGTVRRFVLNAIMETLAAESQKIALLSSTQTTLISTTKATAPADKQANAPATTTSNGLNTPTKPLRPDSQTNAEPAAKPSTVSKKPTPAPTTTSKSNLPTPPASTTQPAKPTVAQTTSDSEQPSPKDSPSPQTSPAPESNKTLYNWRLITLLKKRYALFETERGLFLLHLRNADQRVRFEQICRDSGQTNSPGQRLLIPHPLELEPLASETLKIQLEQINNQGFQIEAFGRNFYRIEAVPTWLSPDQAETFVRDFIDQARLRNTVPTHRKLDTEALAKLAVKESYRRSDQITEQAAQQLAWDLLKCDNPNTSPFGKPTYQEINWSEWERRFEGRV